MQRLVPMLAAVLAASILYCNDAHSQLVAELGGGVGLQGITYLVVDTPANDLYLAGAFTWANNQQVSPGILRWGDEGLQSVGCGVGWDCVAFINQGGLQNPAFALAKWNGDLYLGGSFFFTLAGVEYNWVMRWDGAVWHPIPGIDGPVKSIKVIDDQLIVAGWFTYADTVLANGLARWDGGSWHRVLDVPAFYVGGGPNLVQDVEVYQGEWYLGGNLSSPARDLVKWNGNTWETVGGSFLGTFSQVNKLRVYNDRLYVAGSFSRCPEHAGVPTNPGSGIVAWDGTSWDDLGGGTCGSPNGSVLSMAWWNDELYACGIFDVMGGQPGGRLAKWDGERWCMLTPPSFWGVGGPAALEVYNDSLYIGGSFLVAGGDSMSCFVKWTGGDYTYSCGALSVEEVDAPATEALSCFPNPSDGILQITAPAWADCRCELRVRDAIGRLVMHRSFDCAELDVKALSPGAYSIQLRDPVSGQAALARFIRE